MRFFNERSQYLLKHFIFECRAKTVESSRKRISLDYDDNEYSHKNRGFFLRCFVGIKQFLTSCIECFKLVIEPCLEMINACCEPCCDGLKSCCRYVSSAFGFKNTSYKKQFKNNDRSDDDDRTTSSSKRKELFSFNSLKSTKNFRKHQKRGPKPSASPVVSDQPPTTAPTLCERCATDTSKNDLPTRNKKLALRQLKCKQSKRAQNEEVEPSIQSLTPEPRAGTKLLAKLPKTKLVSSSINSPSHYLINKNCNNGTASSFVGATSNITLEDLSTTSESTSNATRRINFYFPSAQLTKKQHKLHIGMRDFGTLTGPDFDNDLLDAMPLLTENHSEAIDVLPSLTNVSHKKSATEILQSVVHSFLISESTETLNEDLDYDEFWPQREIV